MTAGSCCRFPRQGECAKPSSVSQPTLGDAGSVAEHRAASTNLSPLFCTDCAARPNARSVPRVPSRGPALRPETHALVYVQLEFLLRDAFLHPLAEGGVARGPDAALAVRDEAAALAVARGGGGGGWGPFAAVLLRAEAVHLPAPTRPLRGRAPVGHSAAASPAGQLSASPAPGSHGAPRVRRALSSARPGCSVLLQPGPRRGCAHRGSGPDSRGSPGIRARPPWGSRGPRRLPPAPRRAAKSPPRSSPRGGPASNPPCPGPAVRSARPSAWPLGGAPSPRGSPWAAPAAARPTRRTTTVRSPARRGTAEVPPPCAQWPYSLYGRGLPRRWQFPLGTIAAGLRCQATSWTLLGWVQSRESARGKSYPG